MYEKFVLQSISKNLSVTRLSRVTDSCWSLVNVLRTSSNIEICVLNHKLLLLAPI